MALDHRNRRRHVQQGLTLVECIFSISIVLLLAALGLPGLKDTIMSVRAQAATSALTTDLAWARLAAVTRNRPVLLCPSAYGSTCDGGGRWESGWIGFVDEDRDDRLSPGESVAIRHEALAKSIRMASGEGRPKARFLPDGRSAGSNLTVTICRAKATHARIIVNNAGRIRTERPRAEVGCS